MAELTLTIGTRDALTFTRASVGAKGDPGAAGTNGTNGTNGANATLTVGSVTTLAAGASATVTNTGTSSAAVLAFGIPAGPAGANGTNGTNGINGTNGAPGAAATVAVGTVSTGAAGSSATVTNAGTANAAVLNFAIPRGNTGATASVAVGTTTTGAAGTNATVTNSGTTSAAVLNFTIPRGATGAAGTNGTNGTNGAPGAAATITVGTVTTGAAGSSVVVTNSGSTSAAVLNFTIPRGDAGAAGSGATLPTASAAGQAPVSTGSGTTYTAQNIATQAELDAVASTLTETGLTVADHESRLTALDGIGAGSPHGTHAFWGVRMLTNHGGARFTLGEMEIRATPGGADQCTGGTPYASSEYPTFGLAANAFDNDPANTWKAADGPIVPTLVGYLFAAPVAAAAVRLTPEAVTQFPADVEIVYGAHTPTSATDPDLVVAWSASTTSPGDTTPQLLTDPAYVAPGTSLVDTVATHGTRLTTVEARPALPTATAAGQAPVSTGAGAGYAATDIATQAEHDTLKARVAMLDGTGAPVGSIHGAHTDWRLYVTASNGAPYVGTSGLGFREYPGGPILSFGGVTVTASTEFAGRGKAGAIDADPASQWLSDGTAMPQWIAFKFPTARTLYEIVWQSPTDAGARIPQVAKTQFGDFGAGVFTGTWQDGWTFGSAAGVANGVTVTYTDATYIDASVVLTNRVTALDTTTRSAGLVYAGPTTGSAAAPAFRALVAADVPTLAQSQVTSLVSDLAAKAPLASPALTGTPTAPTATAGTSTTQLATTAFVTAAVAAGGGGGGGSLPTATAAGQAPVSTGAGTTYAAQDVATQVEHDALKARVAMVDGTGAPVGSIYGAHTDWRLYVTASNGAPYVGTSGLGFREYPGGPILSFGGVTVTASTEFAGRGKAGAIDADPASQWLSDGTAMPQWIAFKFPTARTLYEIVWQSPTDAGARIPQVAKTQFGDFGAGVFTGTWQDGWTFGSAAGVANGVTVTYTDATYIDASAVLINRVVALETPGVTALTDGATITWTVTGNAASLASVTLGGNRTLAITGAAAGQRGTLLVTQDGTGSRTLTLPTGSIKETGFALSTAAGAKDRLDYLFDGTSYWWSIRKAYA